jgi:hypothetical protein
MAGIMKFRPRTLFNTMAILIAVSASSHAAGES